MHPADDAVTAIPHLHLWSSSSDELAQAQETEGDVSDQDRIADLEHRLRDSETMLARLADVVRRMAVEVRGLPGVNGSSPAWRDVEEIVRDIERSRGR